jgi:transposase InsO family protein
MEGCTGKEIKRGYFEIIDKLRHRFSISWLCHLYGVSKSGYYRWKATPLKPNRYDLLHQEIDKLTLEMHQKHPSYGYRSICAAILLETGWKLCSYCVMKSMQRLGICSKARKKRYISTGPEHMIFPNILNRRFHTNQPMQQIAVDICQFRSRGKRYFFVAYLDLFNNEILTWNLGTRDDLSLIIPPLPKLLAMKHPDKPLLIHSDQGSQFAAYAYTNLLCIHSVTQSMSRAGNPRDNAVMESCFGWFKNMLCLDFKIHRCDDITATVAQAVVHFNYFRPAYALHYKTPVQFKIAQGF